MKSPGAPPIGLLRAGIVGGGCLLTSFLLTACNAEQAETGGGASDLSAFDGSPLGVRHNRLVRDDGATVVLRGVTLTGANKTPPFTQNADAEDYARLSGMGFNSVRFLITWRAIEPEEAVYDETYLRWLDGMMDAAAAHDVHAILDMHQDLYGGPFATHGAADWTCPDAQAATPIEPWFLNYVNPALAACFDRFYTDPWLIGRFGDMWAMLARRYADHPAVAGFELLNEPFFGTVSPVSFDAKVLGPWSETIARRIREAAPKKLIVFEPSVAKNGGYSPDFPRLSMNGLIYAPHLYSLATETGSAYLPGSGLYGAAMGVDWSEAQHLHAALMIGEWGAIQGWGDTQPDLARALVREFYDRADAGLISTQYWDYGSRRGGGIYRAENALRPFASELSRPTLHAHRGAVSGYRVDVAARTVELAWTPGANGVLEWRLTADANPALNTAEADATAQATGNVFRVEARGTERRRIVLRW